MDSIYNGKEDNVLPSIFLKLFDTYKLNILCNKIHTFKLQIEKHLFENAIYHLLLLLLDVLEEEGIL